MNSSLSSSLASSGELSIYKQSLIVNLGSVQIRNGDFNYVIIFVDLLNFKRAMRIFLLDNNDLVFENLNFIMLAPTSVYFIIILVLSNYFLLDLCCLFLTNLLFGLGDLILFSKDLTFFANMLPVLYHLCLIIANRLSCMAILIISIKTTVKSIEPLL